MLNTSLDRSMDRIEHLIYQRLLLKLEFEAKSFLQEHDKKISKYETKAEAHG